MALAMKYSNAARQWSMSISQRRSLNDSRLEFFKNALKLQRLSRSRKKVITVILKTTVRLSTEFTE